METALVRGLRGLSALAVRAGPYLLIEILMPGGTLLALLLFLFQRLRSAPAARCERVRDGLEPLAMAPPRCAYGPC